MAIDLRACLNNSSNAVLGHLKRDFCKLLLSRAIHLSPLWGLQKIVRSAHPTMLCEKETGQVTKYGAIKGADSDRDRNPIKFLFKKKLGFRSNDFPNTLMEALYEK